ncbi:MAG: hypothetical protein ABIR77_01340 [Sphingomicrobium sp.]
MTSTAIRRQELSLADAQFARVAGEGSARHPHLASLLAASGPNAARDLADAVHLLCNLYGRHPGLIDLALAGSATGPARAWLAEASDHYERERLYLVRLASAVGPLPSTPGAAQTENALQSQRHAIETLARSERRGCALGAATALLADWVAIRPLLDRAAARAGVEAPLPSLPGEASIARVIAAAVDTASSERALSFGAEQLLLQHRALFDLLEARAAARVD